MRPDYGADQKLIDLCIHSAEYLTGKVVFGVRSGVYKCV